MESNQRVLVAVLLSFLVLWGYTMLVPQPKRPVPAKAVATRSVRWRPLRAVTAVAARAAVDREGFRVVLPRREVTISARN